MRNNIVTLWENPIRDIESWFFDNDVFKSVSTIPAADVSEDDKNIYIEANLPGITKEDLDIVLKDGYVTIKAKKEDVSEKKDEIRKFYRKERRFQSFERTLELPDSVDQDKVKASFKDGVLELVFEKAEAKQAKKIEITA